MSSSESVERGFSHIAKVCGLEGDSHDIRRWLSNVSERWLLILDNADDPKMDVSQYFPAGNRGTILLTTRNPDCEIHATVGSRKLGQMETDEAITLILKATGARDLWDEKLRDTAQPVVLTLGCLALAIVQAGAAIRQGLCRMEEYCSHFVRHRGELLHWKMGQGNQGYEYTVYTTWEISLRMIAEMSTADAHDAVEILQMFSFLHHDGISEEIFQQAWKNLWSQQCSEWIRSHQLHILLRHQSSDWDPYLARKALSLLSSFSLISRDKKGLISIHPLVHAWARDRLSCSEQERFWTLTASTIAISIPWAFQIFDYRFRKSLVPHIDACLGFYDDGIFHLRESGQDCLNMADKFALTYGEVGRQQEALQLTETVVEARKRTLGEGHPGTLWSMHNLANKFSEVGRRQEALQLTEAVVGAHKRTLGEEHPDTLGSMHNLAISYSEVGRRQEALQLTEAVLEVRKRTLGEEHPDTLGSMHNLAISYSEVGRRQEALQLTETVVEARKRTLGEEHPDTLQSMHNLTTMKENPNILTESSRQHLESKEKPQTQNPDNKRTKQHSGMSRFWKKLI
jgi:tetratricopeptide (TPR) repeat protein